ncbi:MAG: amidohydrolase [Woeseiaceae bacterium]
MWRLALLQRGPKWVPFLLLGLLLPALLLAQAPDRILHNGKILTVDQEFSIVEALAVSDNQISATGSNEDLLGLADKNTDVIDLEGRTVLPGLIDSHLHYLRGTTFAAYGTEIYGVTSRQEVLDRIRARANELGPGKWVFVIGGWNEQQFVDAPGGFSQQELDDAAPDNPVYMQKSYLDFYMNKRAIDIIAPKIGDLYKGSADVHTNGRDGRTVMYAALEHFPFAETLEGRMQEVREFNNYLNSLGITTVYDVGYLDGSYKPVAALHEAGELSLRAFYALRYWADSPRTAVAAAELLEREEPFQRDDTFGMFGIGEHVYGLLHDFINNPTPFPQEIYDSFELIVTAAAKNGWAINEHAMRDTTAQNMLDISERISETYPIADLRWTLGHADLISTESIERAKHLGWTMAVHNHTLKVPVEGRPSPPIRAIQDSGIIWGMGSDGTMVSTSNPFHTIWEYTAGLVFPNIVKYRSNEVITRREALIAHTRSNAYLLHMEDKIGTLEVGKLADLVVLDRDYLRTPTDEIRDIKAVMTIVDGEIVFRNGM